MNVTKEELDEWETLATAALDEINTSDSKWKGPAAFHLVNFTHPELVLRAITELRKRS